MDRVYKTGEEFLDLTVVRVNPNGVHCYNNKTGRIELIPFWEMDLVKELRDKLSNEMQKKIDAYIESGEKKRQEILSKNK